MAHTAAQRAGKRAMPFLDAGLLPQAKHPRLPPPGAEKHQPPRGGPLPRRPASLGSVTCVRSFAESEEDMRLVWGLSAVEDPGHARVVPRSPAGARGPGPALATTFPSPESPTVNGPSPASTSGRHPWSGTTERAQERHPWSTPHPSSAWAFPANPAPRLECCAASHPQHMGSPQEAHPHVQTPMHSRPPAACSHGGSADQLERLARHLARELSGTRSQLVAAVKLALGLSQQLDQHKVALAQVLKQEQRGPAAEEVDRASCIQALTARARPAFSESQGSTGAESEAEGEGDSANSASSTEDKDRSAAETLAREWRLCRVCLEAVACTVTLPCRHLVVCKECAPCVVECPRCNSVVQGVLHLSD